MKKKEPSTILERLSKGGFPLSQLYASRDNGYIAPLADLILASEQIVAQSREPWNFKSLAQNGREEFIRTGQINGFDRWERDAQRSFAECIGCYIYYEEAEGLLFFVRDGQDEFRVAQPGDEAYDFVRRLNKEEGVSDLRFAKAPTWAEELYLARENLEAHKLIWYDNSGADYEAAKKLKSDAVIRETLRRMGRVPGLTTTNEAADASAASPQVSGEMPRNREPCSVVGTLPHMSNMDNKVIDAPADLVRLQPKSRLVSIVSILRKVAELSEGELTIAELADALASSASSAYDGDTMMLYWGGSSGLAEPIIGISLDDHSGYNQRVDIVTELCNAHDCPGVTILVRPYGRTDVENLLVLKDDGDEIIRRLWKFFYPNQEKTINESVIAEGVDTKRTEEKPGYSTPHLVILNAAIAEFFERRRDRDAKREEVVDWIKSKMTASGMADSDNIAQAIFTIIKPLDHDPKKRRG